MRMNSSFHLTALAVSLHQLILRNERFPLIVKSEGVCPVDLGFLDLFVSLVEDFFHLFFPPRI